MPRDVTGERPHRLGAIESNSSKNSTHGFAALARSNRSRTYPHEPLSDSSFDGRSESTRTDFSLAPMYLFSSSGPLMLMKFSPHSLATAEASSVFPHPG